MWNRWTGRGIATQRGCDIPASLETEQKHPSAISVPLTSVLVSVLNSFSLPQPALFSERQAIPDYDRKVFSQHGEDGVIAKIFEIIEPTTKYAVEFGVYDGLTISNTRELIVKHGRRSFQIEEHPQRAKRLAELYADNPKVTTLQT